MLAHFDTRIIILPAFWNNIRFPEISYEVNLSVIVTALQTQRFEQDNTKMKYLV